VQNAGSNRSTLEHWNQSNLVPHPFNAGKLVHIRSTLGLLSRHPFKIDLADFKTLFLIAKLDLDQMQIPLGERWFR